MNAESDPAVEQLRLCDPPTLVPQMTTCPIGHEYEKNLPAICPECAAGQAKENNENQNQAA